MPLLTKELVNINFCYENNITIYIHCQVIFHKNLTKSKKSLTTDTAIRLLNLLDKGVESSLDCKL